jgi:hypothetical protein
MPTPVPMVHRRDSGHRRRRRRGVRKSPGWVPPLPEVTHADWPAASLRGANQRRVRTAYAVTSATPAPIAPSSHPPPVGGEGAPAGMTALVVVTGGGQTIVMVVWWVWFFSAGSVAMIFAVPQKVPLVLNVPSASKLLLTKAQWPAPVPTFPAPGGLTLKHTF